MSSSPDTNHDITSETSEKIKKTPVIHGLTGIVNTSNTCYMNSAIQSLSHIYPITAYFFNHKSDIMKILKQNARNIFKDVPVFKLDATQSYLSIELREKIQDPNYQASMLTPEEETIILNHTMTFQLIKLLENMWKKNCVVLPTSFRKVFTDARNKFFYGNEQHDAEEAYSCIVQKIQEELSEKKNIKFKTMKPSVLEFLEFKNKIMLKIQGTENLDKKKQLLESYKQKKKEMPAESITIEAFREMKNYYSNTYNRITEIFSGFLYSSIVCPECQFASNRFEPFLHLSLPMPWKPGAMINIQDCMTEYCQAEVLDENNLFSCEGCEKKVRASKKLEIWTCPPVLVVQFKRFGLNRRSKDSRMVTYPLDDLDISDMISSFQRDTTKCYKYTLQCVINHVGGLHGGHYFSYCKDEDSGRWFDYDDVNVNEISEKIVVTKNAYLLFYIRHDLVIS